MFKYKNKCLDKHLDICIINVLLSVLACYRMLMLMLTQN